jgi:hypothetical protein
MTKEEVLGLVGEFTWTFGDEFFVETAKGNFIWSDPDYNGDNTLTRYDGSWDDYRLSGSRLQYGRDKGKHFISAYCGDEVVVVDRIDVNWRLHTKNTI